MPKVRSLVLSGAKAFGFVYNRTTQFLKRFLVKKTYVNLGMLSAGAIIGLGAAQYHIGAGLIIGGTILGLHAYLLGLE